jgi:hypothetical protein
MPANLRLRNPLPLALVFLSFIATPRIAGAGTIYIGDGASSGSALPAGSGSRADALPGLSYIFSGEVAGVAYTVPLDALITIESVNLLGQNAGSVTPFVVIYNGGDSSNANDYTLLSLGDTLSIPSGSASGTLFNESFLVSGVNPTVSVEAGDVLVAGLYETNQTVVFSSTAQSAANDRIWQEDIVNGLSSGQTLGAGGAGFNFNLTYGYDIGFEVGPASDVPEPGPLALVSIGLCGLAVFRRTNGRL